MNLATYDMLKLDRPSTVPPSTSPAQRLNSALVVLPLQNALSQIGADEKVLYAETPTLIDANLITLVAATVTTTIFLIEVGVYLTGSLDLESFALVSLPPAAQALAAVGWYPLCLLLVARSFQRFRRRYLVLTNKKIIYRDGNDAPRLIPYAALSGAVTIEGELHQCCFVTDVLLTFEDDVNKLERLSSLHNPTSVETKLKAIISALRQKRAADAAHGNNSNSGSGGAGNQ
jgi:hypothetical protein